MSGDGDSSVGALVVDLGMGTVKSGFAGDDLARAQTSPLIMRDSKDAANRVVWEGNQLFSIKEQDSATVSITRCIGPGGVVTNWDDFESLLEHVLLTELRQTPEEHPLLMIEPVTVSGAQREKIAQIVFEKQKVPCYQSLLAPECAIYSYGRTSGFVLDIGYESCTASAIFEGHSLQGTVQQSLYGGNDVTLDLQKRLNARGDKTELSSVENMALTLLCFATEKYNATEKYKKPEAKSYKLPDNTTVTLQGDERCAPVELLFNPRAHLDSTRNQCFYGAHELVQRCLLYTHEILRKELVYGGLVLCGGGSMYEGLDDRMTLEMTKLHLCGLPEVSERTATSADSQSKTANAESEANVSTNNAGTSTTISTSPQQSIPISFPKSTWNSKPLRVIASPERHSAAWIGGSIVASLTGCWNNPWYSKEMYDEYGAKGVAARAF